MPKFRFRQNALLMAVEFPMTEAQIDDLFACGKLIDHSNVGKEAVRRDFAVTLSRLRYFIDHNNKNKIIDVKDVHNILRELAHLAGTVVYYQKKGSDQAKLRLRAQLQAYRKANKDSAEYIVHTQLEARCYDPLDISPTELHAIAKKLAQDIQTQASRGRLSEPNLIVMQELMNLFSHHFKKSKNWISLSYSETTKNLTGEFTPFYRLSKSLLNLDISESYADTLVRSINKNTAAACR